MTVLRRIPADILTGLRAAPGRSVTYYCGAASTRSRPRGSPRASRPGGARRMSEPALETSRDP